MSDGFDVMAYTAAKDAGRELRLRAHMGDPGASAELERAELLAQVEAATGVPASVLRGETAEELTAHAAAVAAALVAPRGPAPDPVQGQPFSGPGRPAPSFDEWMRSADSYLGRSYLVDGPQLNADGSVPRGAGVR